MDPATIFLIANNGILVFWLLLIVAPGWSGTRIAVHSIAIPAVLGLTYLWLILSFWSGPVPQGASYNSLTGVMIFLASPVAATAGWIHYLCFDLFVGAWLARDARRRGVPHWLVIPCLLIALLAGPVGLLVYLTLRLSLGKGGFFLSEA